MKGKIGALWKTVFRSRKARKLSLLAGGLLLAFLIGEAFFRIFDPLGAFYLPEMNRHLRMMSYDPDFGIIPEPNSRQVYKGGEIVINSEGLRSPEIEKTKPKGKKRLLALGDSMVFGWGAPQEAIFPMRLQDMMHPRFPDWQVFSAGVVTWNTRNEYEFLKKKGLEYEPDALVLVMLENDINPNQGIRVEVDPALLWPPEPERNFAQRAGRKIQTMWRRLIMRSYLLLSARHGLRLITSDDTTARLYDGDTPAWQDQKAALLGIIRSCRERNIALFVFLFEKTPEDWVTPFKKKIVPFLREESVAFFEIPNRIYEPENRNSSMDHHLNARGHQSLAEFIFEKIATSLEAEP